MAPEPEPPFLPYGRQSLDEDDIAAVVAVLRGDWLTTGPAVERFEAALCAQTGAQHAVAVNSGTAALHVAYFGAGLGPGDELVTSPLTFAATASMALHLGAKVRFADVEPDTGNLDPAAAAAAVSPATRAVVGIDYAGHPADWNALRDVANRVDARLLADAAHSLGATYQGKQVGLLADATATSFHPVKPITTAEGGALLSDDPELARRAAQFRSHGMVRDAEHFRDKDPGPWHYEIQALGLNYRLPDVLCALGVSQLTKLDAFVARRRAIAATYLTQLAPLEGLELPHPRADVESGWHIFPLRVREAARRRPFFEALRARGLGVQVHYEPVHLQPYYLDLGFRPGDCPVAEDYTARALSLPLFPSMSDADVARVIETLGEVSAELL